MFGSSIQQILDRIILPNGGDLENVMMKRFRPNSVNCDETENFWTSSYGFASSPGSHFPIHLREGYGDSNYPKDGAQDSSNHPTHSGHDPVDSSYVGCNASNRPTRDDGHDSNNPQTSHIEKDNENGGVGSPERFIPLRQATYTAKHNQLTRNIHPATASNLHGQTQPTHPPSSKLEMAYSKS